MRPCAVERYGSVGRLWQTCWPLETDRAVASWLEAQRISALAATHRDLARSLGRGRLVVPLYDPWGELAALAAHGTSGETQLLGARMAEGMVFANPIARHVLAGVARERWTWRTIILTAGLVDYLQWAAALAADDGGPAVISLFHDGFSALLASRIPDACRVIVRGDTSPAVAAAAGRVVELLGARCEVVVRAGI